MTWQNESVLRNILQNVSAEKPITRSALSLSSSAAAADAKPLKDSARRQIWELRGPSHCSIIGTCLTLGELRRLARRTGFLADEARYDDYQIHGMFVGKMHEENVVSRATQKHLDAKFEGAIRKAKKLDSDDAFLAYWETAVDHGFVPGAYWALVAHPRLSHVVEVRIFGDVHMMSHICGASNRGDARAIAEARREKADLARRLAGAIADRNDKIQQQRTEIERLTKLIHELEPLAAECGRLRQSLEADWRATRLAAMESEVETLREENAALRDKCARTELQREHLKARLERAVNPIDRSGRQAPAPQSPDDAEPSFEDWDAPDGLCGRCLLYVGGRPRTVSRLKQLVARRNGFLLHHDGGVEHTQAILGDLVRRADAVFFPVDCVSHGAAGAVKALCESHGIPYCPLRTASVAAFQKAIQTFGREPSSRSFVTTDETSVPRP